MHSVGYGIPSAEVAIICHLSQIQNAMTIESLDRG